MGLWAVTWVLGGPLCHIRKRAVAFLCGVQSAQVSLQRIVYEGFSLCTEGFYFFLRQVYRLLYLGFVSYKKTFHHFETIFKVVLFGEGMKKYKLVARTQSQGVEHSMGCTVNNSVVAVCSARWVLAGSTSIKKNLERKTFLKKKTVLFFLLTLLRFCLSHLHS